MPYTPRTWADGPTGGTPIDSAALNRIEAGIDAAVDAADAFASTVAAASTSDRARANHTGTQLSTTISDFAEAAQDAAAALLTQGTGVTLTYNDAGNTLTVTSTGGTGGGITDPEVVRDTIGAALIGVGPISVALNDAADTITITSSATTNSTDTALRDRSTHTGTDSLDTTADTATRVAMTPAERTKLTGVATGATANRTDAAVDAILAAKAPLADPTFTGAVTVPTPTTATGAATKGYVDTAVSNVPGGSGLSATDSARIAGSLFVIIYSSGAYATRPSGVPAGLVRYVGPTQPTTWLANDEWVNNS